MQIVLEEKLTTNQNKVQQTVIQPRKGLEKEYMEESEFYDSIEDYRTKNYGCDIDSDGNVISTFNKQSFFDTFVYTIILLFDS